MPDQDTENIGSLEHQPAARRLVRPARRAQRAPTIAGRCGESPAAFRIALAMMVGLGGPVLGLALMAQPAIAQAPRPAVDAGPAAAPTVSGMLPPGEIIASVRSAGFDPLSRPVARGAVYVVFATNRYLVDVRLTVDARTGRVLSATRLAGAAYGGPIYEGSLPHALPHSYPPVYAPPVSYARPPVPPAPIPPAASGRNIGTAPDGAGAAKRISSAPKPPVPRARPDENATGAEPNPAADEVATSPPAAPSPPAVPAPPPAMVPVAPLE